MRTRSAPEQTGPEGLFAVLAEPRLAFFRQSLVQAPLRASLLFAATMVGLTMFLALVQVRAVDQGAVGSARQAASASVSVQPHSPPICSSHTAS